MSASLTSTTLGRVLKWFMYAATASSIFAPTAFLVLSSNHIIYMVEHPRFWCSEHLFSTSISCFVTGCKRILCLLFEDQIAAFPASFLGKADVADPHGFVDCLAHIVDCQCCRAHRCERLHFDSSFAGCSHSRLNCK